MEIKTKKIEIIGKDYKGRGNPIKMRLHYSIDNGEYVLCQSHFFGLGFTHFTLEECEDMVKILKDFIKEQKELK